MKNLIISILIANLFAAPAFAEMSCKSWGPRVNFWGPKPISSNEEVIKEHDMMEEHEGVGRFFAMPKSYEEAFFQEKDFDIEEIDRRSEKTKEIWSNDLEISRLVASMVSFDLSIFRELNLAAYTTWQKMIACNGGDKAAARKNYFTGNPCPISKEKNQELVRDLSDLNTGLADFLLTSDIFNLKGTVAKALPLPEYHPLLTQILLQQFATTLNLADEKRQDWVLALNEVMEIVLPEHEYSPVLFIKPDSQMIGLVKSIVNTSILVASIPGDSSYMHFMRRDHLYPTPIAPSTEETCSRYGLWPGMNRTVLFPLGNYFATHTALSEPLAEIGQIMAAKAIVNCGGEISVYEPQDRGTYSRFAPIHIHELRRLAATYYPEKLGGRGFDTLLTTQGYTKYQKALCNWW